MAKLDGIGLGSMAVGGLLVYAGVKGISIPSAIQLLISGKSPAGASAANQVSGSVGSVAAGVAGAASTVAGSVLSNGQIQALWIMAGGDPGKAAVAACIASHESSGRTSVTSPNPDGGTNVGLWQLDTPGGVGAGFTVAQLQDPMTNARAAIKGSKNGTDWSDWSTAPMCGV